MIDTPTNLTRNILLGLFLGFLVGSFLYYTDFFPSSFDSFVELYIFKMGGEIFMNLLKLLVVPLVFFSLVTGISSLGSSQSLGSLTFKTVGFYLLTTAIAVSLALLAGSFFQPGSNYSADIALAAPSSLPQGQGIYSTITGIFPSNIIQAMADNQMLAIVFFSILFGLALNKTNHLTGNFSESFAKLNTVFLQLIVMVMSFAPIGVFCLIGKFVIADGLDIFQDVLAYVVLLISLLIFHALFTYSIFLKFIGGLSPITFFKKIKNVALFAFSTSSSAATIPVTLKTVNQDLGVNQNVASFVVPVGATINMDGTAIMQGVATIFIANAYNIDLTTLDYLMVILTATMASIGTAGVPGVGLIMLAMVLAQVGLPTEGIALILGVDRLLDMIRTVVNVTGDSTVSTIVAYSEDALDSNNK